MKVVVISAVLALGAAAAFAAPGAVRLEQASPDASGVPEKLPLGITPELWALSIPNDKTPQPKLVALGDKLFNDKRLSVDDTVSCATCHDPKKGFVDGLALSEGIKKQKTGRNSPTVLNAMFGSTQFWDGRAATLEEQAKLPITNPIEMGMKDGDAVMAKVRAIPEYKASFQDAFGRDGTFDDLATAIAAFERTQFVANAPFDRFIRGESAALDAQQKRGWSLFNGKARCNTCHAGNVVQPLFTDLKFHNIGVAARKQDFVALSREALVLVRTGDQEQIDRLAIESAKFTELGRFLVTKNENEVGAFRTPGLRDIAITGPYMHDGSMETLWDVVDHYNKGGLPNPYLDGGMQRLGLTEPEVEDLVSFMFALTSDRFTDLGKKKLTEQKVLKAKARPERDAEVALGRKSTPHMGDVGVTADKKNPAQIGLFGTEAVK